MTVASGLDPKQVRDLVVRPVLKRLDMPSPDAAERLLMGTAAQESRFKYLKQVGGGPALGLWQMEPATFDDLWERFAVRFNLDQFVNHSIGIWDQLTWDLALQCAMARVHYWARPFPLPKSGVASVEEMAGIWKLHYNTIKGKGKPEEFAGNYLKLVAPIYD